MPYFRIILSAALAPFLVVLVCALLAALLAYPLFFIAGDAVGFHTLVNRSGHLLLLLSTLPAAKFFRLRYQDLGVGSKSTLFRRAVVGIPLGTAMLTLHALALIALDVRHIDEEAWSNMHRLGWIALKALSIGLIVASIEEAIFRGVLFGSLQKTAGALTASLVSSFYFALLHFLRSDIRPAVADVDWTTGFRLVADALVHLSAIDVSSFVALFLAGIFLTWVRMAFPAGLGYCIGIHAGWVCAIKTVKAATNTAPSGYWSFLIGSYDGMIGYLTAGWMSILIVLLVIRAGHPSKPERNPQAPDRFAKGSV